MAPKENKPFGDKPGKSSSKVRTTLQVRPDGTVTKKQPRLALTTSSGNRPGLPSASLSRKPGPPPQSRTARKSQHILNLSLDKSSSPVIGCSSRLNVSGGILCTKTVISKNPIMIRGVQSRLSGTTKPSQSPVIKKPHVQHELVPDPQPDKGNQDLIIAKQRSNRISPLPASTVGSQSAEDHPTPLIMRMAPDKCHSGTRANVTQKFKHEIEGSIPQTCLGPPSNAVSDSLLHPPMSRQAAVTLEPPEPDDIIRQPIKYPHSRLGRKLEPAQQQISCPRSVSLPIIEPRKRVTSDEFIQHAKNIRKFSPLVPHREIFPGHAIVSVDANHPTCIQKHNTTWQDHTAPVFPNTVSNVHWDLAILEAGPAIATRFSVAPQAVFRPLQVDHMASPTAGSEIQGFNWNHLLVSMREMKELDRQERHFLMEALKQLSNDEDGHSPCDQHPSMISQCLRIAQNPHLVYQHAHYYNNSSSPVPYNYHVPQTSSQMPLKQKQFTPAKPLNPCVPEFRSMRPLSAKPLRSSEMQSGLPLDLTNMELDMQRNELELQQILRKKEELENVLQAQDSKAHAPKTPLPRKRVTVLDDTNSHGREVRAFDDWFANKQLEEFQKKYPMTGIKHIANNPKPPPRFPKSMVGIPPLMQGYMIMNRIAKPSKSQLKSFHQDSKTLEQKKHAAQVQLRLETLLLQKREKKAAEMKIKEIESARYRAKEREKEIQGRTKEV